MEFTFTQLIALLGIPSIISGMFMLAIASIRIITIKQKGRGSRLLAGPGAMARVPGSSPGT